jgi:hypothetical protein
MPSASKNLILLMNTSLLNNFLGKIERRSLEGTLKLLRQ